MQKTRVYIPKRKNNHFVSFERTTRLFFGFYARFLCVFSAVGAFFALLVLFFSVFRGGGCGGMRHSLEEVLHDEAGHHETEDGGDMRHGAVDLRFAVVPVVSQEVGATFLRVGAVADGGFVAVDGCFAKVGKNFVAVDAEEFLGRTRLGVLKLLAKCATERTTMDFVELRHADACGIHLQRCTHGGNEEGRGLASAKEKMSFFGERVDGIDDDVVGVELERLGILRVVDVLDGSDFGGRIDGEETFAEHFHLHLSHGLRGGHELAIDIADVHAVRIDNGEMHHAGAHQAFCAPAAHAAHTEEDDAQLMKMLQRSIAHEEA